MFIVTLATALTLLVPSSPVAIKIDRSDNSSLTISLFDRGSGSKRQVLLVTTGSDCRDAKSQKWMPQVLSEAAARWVAVVEKDGASAEGTCGPDYESHSTEEARWFDTLEAMRVLKDRLHLPEKYGFKVLSISAGGLTGCAVAGATHDVAALALLSTGGGISFAREFALLNKDNPRLNAQEVQVQRHPQIGRTWLGETNPEIWWWSALPKRCLPLLSDFRGHVLVEQGNADDAVPPASAEALVDGLHRADVNVEYKKMPTGHDLGLGNLPASQNGVAYALAWLARH